MTRYKIVFGYDGSNFLGYQVQPKGRTVQQELDIALSKVFQSPIRTTASGRTDRGVHAMHQVAHFDIETSIPTYKLAKVINAFLPSDIVVYQARKVKDTFHARYDVIEKTYCYVIDNRPYPDVLQRRYAFHIEKTLDISTMKEAAIYLLGEHDFTAFCSQKTDVQDKVRTIYGIEIKKRKQQIKIYVTGNGFLYNMVRIIAGALIEVGKGNLLPIQIKEILETKDRTKGTITAPPHGLSLWSVKHKKQ
ncbi:tRNA pseudouridine(38-40) synthase TruA [Desulfuribacillus stibiiarsenatis]|uniref:tRNA pseudouridine synthase A n=1 Tax=Desulfuribacillus stibiiarsenatis TaxID=1390249 RepID=A0A1E5L8N9_9FIRM|nr:tRNA pseudouridine(38-40) synthase TruA [Desulfuribacillus stibiiarsenatis]OEH86359.1 tRNA pseudouridine(38-40) synthase TruA [Desulfuribacillus stibiiarsenatis]